MGRGLHPNSEDETMTTEERETMKAQALQEILDDLEILEENARNTLDQCALTRAAILMILGPRSCDVPTKKERVLA